MKHNDAASHHAKRPHAAHRTSHEHHAAAHHATKKVFDIMRPGKTPASPTSRPVIMGHKQSAQKSQASVSGIGEAVPVAAAEKPTIETKKLIQSEELDHAAQVAAAASASLAAGLTDPEDTPAGAPPVAIDETPAVAVAPAVDPPSSEPEAKSDTPQPVTQEPKPVASESAPAPTSVPEAPKEPPKDIPSIDPAATHGITHGKTIVPLSQQGQAPEPPAVPAPATPAPNFVPASGLSSPSPAPSAPLPSGDSKPVAPASAPQLHPNDIQDIVVSHHATSVWWHAILLLVLVIVLGVIVVDILLDAEIITISGVPYTDFF